MKKNYILLYLMITTCSNLFSMETSPENWVFVRYMPGLAPTEEDKGRDWRIKDQKLELNLNAKELITQSTFADLIRDAKNEKLPLILLMAQSGDQGQYIHFLDGSVINDLMANWKKEKVMENPSNRQEIVNMEIYVAGDDGKIRLLKDNVDPNFLDKFFVMYDGLRQNPQTYVRYHLYRVKPALTIPGVAQAFIAGLYGDQSLKMINEISLIQGITKEAFEKMERLEDLEKEEEYLRAQLTILQQQKSKAILPIESENLSEQINSIEADINQIEEESEFLQELDPEIEKLLQLERLWLSWAIDKFLPRDPKNKKAPKEEILERMKKEALDRLEKIEYKPQHLED